MRREDKIRFILEDEKIRQLERQNQLLEMENIINGPSFPESQIDEDDFQTEEVELGESKTVFSINLESGYSMVVQYIGNDWYPGIIYNLYIDGDVVLENIQREIAPTNNPLETSILVRESIRWDAENDPDVSPEARDLGVVTGGRRIPVSIYDRYVDMYNTAGLSISQRNTELLKL